MSKSSLLPVILVVWALGSGCGKKPDNSPVKEQKSPANTSVSVATDNSAPPPPPPPSAPAGTPEPQSQPQPTDTENEGRNGFLKRVYSSDPQVAVTAMNQFIAGRNMTATTELKSMEQLVAEAGWPRMPKAPAGSRYALDPQTRLVVLIK